MISMAKVLVYGGTGSQARPTVLKLLERGHQPHVVTRDASKESDLESLGVALLEGSMGERDKLFEFTNGMDAIAFLVPAFLGESDDAVAFGRNVIDATEAAGIKKFVWNASGPIPREQDPNDAKSIILAYLQNSALDYVVFEPTTYMENWLGPWTAPFVKSDDIVTYPVLDHVKIGWLASDDVGSLVVAAIESDAVSKRCFDISGTEAPVGPELAQKFSNALGRDIKYVAMTPEKMGKIINEAFGGGGDRIADMYRTEQNDPDLEPKYHDMSSVLELLPVEMTTIEDWVRQNADQFTN